MTASSTGVKVKSGRQSGVALIQVLLIGSVISLLAIRFTETARDQLEMATQLDLRVMAELKAYSVQNEVVFLHLSDVVTPTSLSGGAAAIYLPPRTSLNRYGLPISWADGVLVEIQDLNGVLPHLYPDHIFWERLLYQASVDGSDIERYIGVWSDMQDPDWDTWNSEGEEPVANASGGSFVNGYAQNDKIVRWVFADRPELLSLVLNASDVNASYEMNIYNAPALLLEAILEPDMARMIISDRKDGGSPSLSARQLLLDEFPNEGISMHNSNRLKISVTINLPSGSWVQSQTVYLNALSTPPFVSIEKRG